MNATIAVTVLLGLAALPVLFCAGYLFVLSVVGWDKRPPAYAAPRTRFDVIVPAHNEADAIAATVKSLLEAEYPSELRRIVVVADNCTDATAEKAAAAGASVIVRNNAELRGKGYALQHAFERTIAEGTADAVVVVDADTSVSKNLLAAMAHRIEAGANAAQAEYGVRNPEASWRTRLMVIALALFHKVRSLARERMGLSAGLRGNGMSFSIALLRQVPHDAFSIVEDVEYGIRIGRVGHRVHYAWEAHVYGEMVASEQASRSQRQRWEGGRLQIAKTHGLPLLMHAFRKRDRMLFDLAMDVLVPPLSYLALAAFLGAAVASGWAAFSPATGYVALIPWSMSLAFVSFYVFRGWLVSGAGARGLLALMWAPVYLVWKLGLALRRPTHKAGEWVRTAREGERPQ